MMVKANSTFFIGRSAGSASIFYYQKGRFIITAGQSVISGITSGINGAPVMDMEFCSVLAMVQAVVIAPRAEASARRALAPRRAKRSNPLYKECRGDRPVAPTSAAIAVLPVRCTQTGSQ